MFFRINPEIKEFWMKQGNIRMIPYLRIIQYVVEFKDTNAGVAVIAEYEMDYDIWIYCLHDKWYSEQEMLKIIKMISFV